MKGVVVLFTDKGARIRHVADVSPYCKDPRALINPVFPKGIPPHLWKLEDGKLGVLSTNETYKRPERKVNKLLLLSLLSNVLFLTLLLLKG